MAAEAISFRWKTDLSVIAENVAEKKRSIVSALLRLGRVLLAQMLDYAKIHAPWTDRTSNARQGLSGAFAPLGTAVAFVLYYTVEYGIWLEVKNGARFGILLRTIREYVPRILAMLRALFAGGA
jgi:hypothetical protein